MAIPTTREEFKKTCLRKLGWPAIKINLPAEAIDDRIDEALKYYFDYHYDGADKEYYKIQVTDQMKADGYITLPSNTLGVVDIFDINSTSSGGANLFSAKYQLFLSELVNIGSMDIAPYYFTMHHIEFLQQELNGKQPLRFVRNENRLYLDMDWNSVVTGEYLIAVIYRSINPVDFPQVWKDKWLTNYATALIKENWGEVLSKFQGIPTVGGFTFNGQVIKDEARAEKMKLEEEMLNTYSLPTAFMIG